jgi:hypothetical protein
LGFLGYLRSDKEREVTARVREQELTARVREQEQSARVKERTKQMELELQMMKLRMASACFEA